MTDFNRHMSNGQHDEVWAFNLNNILQDPSNLSFFLPIRFLPPSSWFSLFKVFKSFFQWIISVCFFLIFSLILCWTPQPFFHFCEVTFTPHSRLCLFPFLPSFLPVLRSYNSISTLSTETSSSWWHSNWVIIDDQMSQFLWKYFEN